MRPTHPHVARTTSTRFRAWRALLVVSATSLATSVAADQNPPKSQPTFRASVELIQLDVSVLDKSRLPVAGLTASDFTVLIDGKRRPVVAFKAVDVPPPAPASSAPWMREITTDVATNIHPSGRVVAILIDDHGIGGAGQIPGASRKARQTAQAVIDALGVDDRAAVLFTSNGHSAQGFTTDRRLLTTAIERSAIFGEPGSFTASTGGGGSAASTSEHNGACYLDICPIEALIDVAQSLRSLPEQRKILVYISPGSVILMPKNGAAGQDPKRDAMYEAIRVAQLANVTIQAIDPKGLTLGRFDTSTRIVSQVEGGPQSAQTILDAPTTARLEFLRTIAESTGGRAVVNNNDMEQQVPALLVESGSYYLLGVEPAATVQIGRFHPVKVQVGRRGVEVRTHTGFYESTAKERTTLAAASESPGLPLSMAGPVPKSDIPLEVTAAPFATTEGKGAVAIALGVRQPADAGRPATARTEMVDIAASLFNPETGKNVGMQSQQVRVGWTGSDASDGYYEVLSHLSAAPGRYELRVGMKGADGRTASVYTYVEIPDFAGDNMTLSGLVLSATPGPKVAHDDGFGTLLPVVPTVRRAFSRTGTASAFLRVYQGKAAVLSPATITTRITDASNVVVNESSTTLTSVDAATPGSADYRFDLPIRDLPAGDYLLTVQVAANGRTSQRELRFRVANP